MSGERLQVAAGDGAPIPSELPLADLLLLWTQGHRLLRQLVASLAGRSGLSDTEYLVLRLWGQTADGASAQCDLAADLGISAAQMSGLMERLRQRDLVTSERCPGDRRRQVWQLTAVGSHAVAQVERDLKERSAGLAPYVEIPPLRRLLRELARRAGLPDANLTLRTFPPAEHAAPGRLGGSP